MKGTIWRFVIPDAILAEEHLYMQTVASRILTTSLIITGVFIIIGIINRLPYTTPAAGIGFAGSLLMLWLTRRGYLTFFRIVFPAFDFILATSLIVTQDGLHDTALFLYPLMFVLAGLLLGTRGIIIYAILILGTITIVGFAEVNGLIVNQFSMSSIRVITIDVLMSFTAILLYVTIDNLTQSLERTRQLYKQIQRELSQRIRAEKALQQAHDELTSRVDELAALNHITQIVASVSSNHVSVNRSQLSGHPEELSTEYDLLFTVKDTGPGIPPEELESLFEVFAQKTIGKGTQEGAGLGLVLSHKFVQLMGGNISVESHIGHGTIFTFRIRCEPADSSEHEQPEFIRSVVQKSEQAYDRKTLVPEAFAVLPHDILDNLEQAAIQGDITAIEHLIEAIRPHHAGLAESLAMLADEFDYGKIVAHIQECRSTQHEHAEFD